MTQGCHCPVVQVGTSGLWKLQRPGQRWDVNTPLSDTLLPWEVHPRVGPSLSSSSSKSRLLTLVSHALPELRPQCEGHSEGGWIQGVGGILSRRKTRFLSHFSPVEQGTDLGTMQTTVHCV